MKIENLFVLGTIYLSVPEGEHPMMKIYICPECGWLRLVSRRKDVECHRCGTTQMTQTNLDFVKYSDMTDEERRDYAQGWLYIHRKSGN